METSCPQVPYIVTKTQPYLATQLGEEGEESESSAKTDLVYDANEVSSSRNTQDRVTCEMCSMTLPKCSLKRHIEQHHGEDTKAYGICVDSENGVYMVRKENRGVNFPCHVKKKVCDAVTKEVLCEIAGCFQMCNYTFPV